MFAVEISCIGPPNVLKVVERPKPVAKKNEVVIHVEAAGVARADVLQRQGKYPPPPGASDIPGLDVAGFIDSVGEDVQYWRNGDHVCAIVPGGGYAEFCAVPAVQVLPVPQGWNSIEATALPENLFVVYDNLITRAGLTQGETVLIHGGTSGVGSAAIMLSRARGAIPFATAGSLKKCEACIYFGAEDAINYKERDFVTQVKRVIEGAGVNVVLDMVGGPYLDRNLDALAPEGRLTIVAPEGNPDGKLDIGKLMAKRLHISGSTMRARSIEQKGLIAQRLLRDVWPLLSAKRVIRPIIDSTFSLQEARLAHERIECEDHIGKIVIVT
ncbi:MAG: NAD(P)H-quinone oxidoreductase [Bryobacteraceae bacterium]